MATVCRSDYSLLTMEDSRPWFQEKYTLVRNYTTKITDMRSVIIIDTVGT